MRFTRKNTATHLQCDNVVVAIAAAAAAAAAAGVVVCCLLLLLLLLLLLSLSLSLLLLLLLYCARLPSVPRMPYRLFWLLKDPCEKESSLRKSDGLSLVGRGW